jgi:hypothetical protein
VPVTDDDDPEYPKRLYLRGVLQRFGIRSFVETGTSEGFTVCAVHGLVDQLVSIELQDAKYQQALCENLNIPHVKILHGDSAVVLEQVVQHLRRRPTLFWLDSHMSEADGVPDSTPIEAEIRNVLHHWPAEMTWLMIDDARLFGASPYPTLDHVRQLIETWHGKESRFDVFVVDDIIHAWPKRRSEQISLEA